MAENISIDHSLPREQIYEALLPQLRSLVEGEKDLIANLANISAALKEALSFHWIGFYLNKNDELVLGPFQGPVACTRIHFGKGVCGTSASQMKTLIVPDVTQFPGHITCSPFSRSEIVIPLVIQSKTELVLDIDSEHYSDFDENDKFFFENVVSMIGSIHFPE